MSDAGRPDRPPEHHDHGTHGRGHGHAHDRGVRATVRYLRWAREMWHSDINDAVIELVRPIVGERVLDIGAGMGPGTVLAARTGASVVAVEPTPFMRRTLAVRRCFLRDRARVTVMDGAAEHLPVADASIDAVWAVNSMHHWVDAQQAAGEIARVLRPGGRVVLVDEDFDDPAHPDHERFASTRSENHRHHFEVVDLERRGRLFAAAGLVDVDARAKDLRGRPVRAVTARAAG